MVLVKKKKKKVTAGKVKLGTSVNRDTGCGCASRKLYGFPLSFLIYILIILLYTSVSICI